MQLRYGLNPGQRATAVAVEEGRQPVRVVAGAPSYINLLDALQGWQLVCELSSALGRTAAASLKHVSPAGAATAGPLDEVMEETWSVPAAGSSDAASAYVRARDADPKSSYGDFVAVSASVDTDLAEVLRTVVSDGIVAPAYEPGVVEVLSRKKRGTYLVLEADATYEPPEWETREVWGVRLAQEVRRTPISHDVVERATSVSLPATAVDDLVLALITARYTQSNSVAYARGGMVLGVGAGQQSRVDCTAIAGGKVDQWWLRRHPEVKVMRFPRNLRRQDRINTVVNQLQDGGAISPDERQRWVGELDDVVMASDGYIPFRDSIDQAARRGVRYVAHPGGSIRTPEVDEACAEHGISLISTGVRLFHH